MILNEAYVGEHMSETGRITSVEPAGRVLPLREIFKKKNEIGKHAMTRESKKEKVKSFLKQTHSRK